jgi:steroid Delta-isomerase
MRIEELIAFYQQFTPRDVARLGEFYSDDAWFKDPFNEVRGLPAIQLIFIHMFRQVEMPRFVITEHVVAQNGAMLAWEFHYLLRVLGRNRRQVVRGVSHLKFDSDGKVAYHRDYWDAAEELYMKLPLVGGLMRWLRARLTARQS